MTTNCKAFTTNGKRCKAKPATGADFCFIHDPSQAQKRAQARRKGGEATRTPHGGTLAIIPTEINTIQDARKILIYALAELAPMENSLQRVRAYLALFDSFVKSIEIGEIENRLAALEAKR